MNRILVVDDNADNRYSIRLILGGFDVIEASGGEEAILRARTDRPDCILLDVQMPGMDGFEVCRRLRGDEATRSIPIILVTAHNRDTESVVRGLAAGGDDYVTKPVAPQELVARVRAMLRIHDLQEQLNALNRSLESQIQRRTDELRLIYATVPVGIYTLDIHGRVTSFNRHMEKMLGYSAEEVVGKMSVSDLFGPDYDSAYWLELCWRDGRSQCEAHARSKSGGVVPVFDERVVVFDAIGERTGYAGYLQDLTRQMRVRELLAEQEKQAGIGRLASVIVHEIANPVGGVLQYLDAIVRRLEKGENISGAEVRRGAEVMADALRRTTDLIQNLRGFTRPAVRPGEEVDLLQLLKDLQTLFRHDLHRRKIAMEVTGEPCVVKGDSGRLAQVFVNLVTNARDAMPKGGAITVDVGAQDSTARVRVTDTGVGIPPGQIGRVFEFLYTTKGSEGTGYGLTISKDIVEGHGGTIGIESQVGTGTTVTVSLPLGTPVARPPA